MAGGRGAAPRYRPAQAGDPTGARRGGPITDDQPLHLDVGCRLELRSVVPTAGVLHVAPHDEQAGNVVAERWEGLVDGHRFLDEHGNRCERFTVPSGTSSLAYRGEVTVPARPDEVVPDAREAPPEELADDLLRWVLPSRFCHPDELGAEAWERFGQLEPGWGRVQAICDHVHDHLDYVVGSSNPWTTATEAWRARQGVCRDYAHLAITFCRALNIPARYVCGYLPDLGVPRPVEEESMDFAAWFEVHLSGRWRTFDAWLDRPRVGGWSSPGAATRSTWPC